MTAFLAMDFFGGNVGEPCLPRSMHCFRPLVSGCPASGPCPRVVEEHADVPLGTVFGGLYGGSFGIDECFEGGALCGPKFVAATPDMSHIVLEAEAVLAPGGEPGKSMPAGEYGSTNDLYEWADGHLTFVGGDAILEHDGVLEVRPGVISDDGSRVIFQYRPNGELAKHELLMRDTVTGQLVRLDAVQGGSGEGPPPGSFQGASGDASTVFFTDEQRLTANAGAEAGAPDLYVCDMVEGAGGLSCKLTDLTPSHVGEAADVLGSVIGVSEDGAWVYFVADGALAPGAVRGTCPNPGSPASPGSSCGLYVAHRDGSEWEAPKLVAMLSGEDQTDWETTLRAKRARVSPNGEWLAFMSRARLTGYDNRDAVSGEPDTEVYLYDARTGSLMCASCNPTGARPAGGANVPGWQSGGGNTDTENYQSRYLDDSGRLFFNSGDALVPQDVDGVQDVYEYEPEGVGSCTGAAGSGSVVFKPARAFSVEGRAGVEGAGCVGLISSGNSVVESEFLDGSEDGTDAFFLTNAQLAPQDQDTAPDVYDVHECSAQSPCPSVVTSPPACDNESSCKAAPSPQPAIYGLPPSATFSGVGNLAPPPPTPVVVKKVTGAKRCGKGLVRERGRCVRSRRGRKVRGRARRASRDRRSL